MDAYTERRLALELEHLKKWAGDQTGFQEYAEWKAMDLAKKEPEVFAGLLKLVQKQIDSKKHGPRLPYMRPSRSK